MHDKRGKFKVRNMISKKIFIVNPIFQVRWGSLYLATFTITRESQCLYEPLCQFLTYFKPPPTKSPRINLRLFYGEIRKWFFLKAVVYPNEFLIESNNQVLSWRKSNQKHLSLVYNLMFFRWILRVSWIIWLFFIRVDNYELLVLFALLFKVSRVFKSGWSWDLKITFSLD